MARPRHGGGQYRDSRFGVSFIEASLALSVIVGLLFVTLRIMAMPRLSAPDAAAQPAIQTEMVVQQTQTSALDLDQSGSKIP